MTGFPESGLCGAVRHLARIGRSVPGGKGRSTLSRSSRIASGWAVPGLFTLLIATTIRQHSWRPDSSYPDVAANIGLFAALLLLMQCCRGVSLHIDRRWLLPSVLLGVSVAISSVLAVDTEAALLRARFDVTLLLMAAAIYIWFRDQPTLPLRAFFLALSVIHLPFLLEVLVEVAASRGNPYPNGPSVPNFSNVRFFGAAGCIAAICATGLVAVTRLRLLPLLLTTSALFGVIAMGSRGALLAWLVFALVLLVAGVRRIWLVLHTALALCVAAVAVYALNATRLFLTPNIFLRQSISSGLNNYSSGRVQLWLDTWRAFVANPWFGLGPDGLLATGCCEQGVHHPHNIELQLLVALGVVGMAAAAYFAFIALVVAGGPRRVISLIRQSEQAKILGAILVAFVVYAQVEGVLYHVIPLMHFVLFGALFAAALRAAGKADHAMQ